MNVPKLRFKEFNDEWNDKCLNDIASITMGQSPNSKNYTSNKNDTILIQGNADLNEGHVVPRLFTTQVTKTCNINDILMTVRAPVGDIAISEYNACIGRGVCSISGDKYIYHYLDYLKTKDYWKKISKGSTIDSITSNDIKKLRIKFPNNDESKKIVKTMDLLNKKIELQIKKLEDLKLFKKGLLDIIFNNNFINSKKLNELNIIVSDGNYGELYPKSNELTDIGEVPFIRVNNLVDLHLTFNNMKYITKEKHASLLSGHLQENDILITTRGDIGKVAIVDKKFIDANINAQIALLRLNNKSEVIPYYLLEYLNYNYNYIQTFITGSALKQLPIKNLMKLQIKFPSIEIQRKYSKLLIIYNKKIGIENQILDKLNELKKGLMQSMFV